MTRELVGVGKKIDPMLIITSKEISKAFCWLKELPGLSEQHDNNKAEVRTLDKRIALVMIVKLSNLEGRVVPLKNQAESVLWMKPIPHQKGEKSILSRRIMSDWK